ncbi:MAG: MBL fold metallo-hydrolase [Acidimicrobiales bacterium]
MITVTLLGTGSPMPDPNRAGPATLVSSESEHYLIDAGRGVMMRLAARGVGAGQLTAVLITHLHSDHITDLNDVITSQWIMTFEPTPLTIVGPVRTGAVVDHIVAALEPDVYRIAHHADLPYRPPVEVIEVEAGVVSLPEVAIRCARPITSLSSRALGFVSTMKERRLSSPDDLRARVWASTSCARGPAHSYTQRFVRTSSEPALAAQSTRSTTTRHLRRRRRRPSEQACTRFLMTHTCRFSVWR